jgi:hypothetical protein
MTFVDFTACGNFVDFGGAYFEAPTNNVDQIRERETLLSSLIYRPTIYERKRVRWIAAHAWRSDAKERGMAALKAVKNDPDPAFIANLAEPVAALIRQLFGTERIDAVTCIPCGHSRRKDCFGKRLAHSVAEALSLPFVQVFADRPREGVSHPKQSTKLPPLRQIARMPELPESTIVIDDLATSGGHLEQALLALRKLNVAASAVAWISGSRTGGVPLGGDAIGIRATRLQPHRSRTATDTESAGKQNGGHETSRLASPSLPAV